MSIDVGDIVAFLSLLIALSAAMNALVLYMIRRDDKDHRVTLKRLDASEEMLRLLVTEVCQCVFDIDKRIKVGQGQIERLLAVSSIAEDVRSRIVLQFNLLNSSAQRELQELSLLRGESDERLSAARQLAEGCGSVTTLELFRIVTDRESNIEVRTVLSRYANLLKSRLDGTKK